jgi:hypothetical protein
MSLEYATNGLRVDAFAVAQPELLPRTDLPVEGTPLGDFGYDIEQYAAATAGRSHAVATGQPGQRSETGQT